MTTAATTTSLQQELAEIVGESYVRHEQVEINGVTPSVSVSPASPQEIAAVLRLASERELVAAPAGGFTKQQIGGIPERVDILLRTDRLNQIRQYDPGDLTIGINAGVRFGEMQNALHEHQQWIPYDPPNQETATMGGLLATASFGPLKSGFGGLRDFCIGIQFVTGDGTMGKGGGNVVKNVAGYDLMKLMIGSYGSLAIITGANFKVFPRPRQTRAFICAFASFKETVAFRDQIVRSPLTPICLELVSPHAVEYLQSVGAAQAGSAAAGSNQWQIVLRFSGSDSILARCRRELGTAVVSELDGASEAQFWNSVSQFEFNMVERHRNAIVIYVHTTIQNVEAVVQALERSAPEHSFVPAMLGRAGIGSLILGFIPVSTDALPAMQYVDCVRAFRSLLPPGTSAMAVHCPKEAKAYLDVWGSSPTDLELMRGVKTAVDPKRVLNRGRFVV